MKTLTDQSDLAEKDTASGEILPSDPKPKPREWWIVPWSIGFECRTKKPQEGESIHVIEFAAYEALRAQAEKLASALEWYLQCRDNFPGDKTAIAALREFEAEALIKWKGGK